MLGTVGRGNVGGLEENASAMKGICAGAIGGRSLTCGNGSWLMGHQEGEAGYRLRY